MKAEHRQRIAAAHKGKRHTEDTRAAIGAGVRHGSENKVVYSTKIDAAAKAKLDRVSERDGKPKAQIIEELIFQHLD